MSNGAWFRCSTTRRFRRSGTRFPAWRRWAWRIRPADPIGRYVWHVRLRQGSTPEQLWAELLVSPRFLQDYPYTEDDYREMEEGYLDSNGDGAADGATHDFSARADDLVAALGAG